MSLPLVPLDKANHALYGYAVSVVVGYLAHAAGVPYWREAGIAASAIVGAAKEGADRYQNYKAGIPVHGVEWKDFLATVTGGAAAMLSAYV